MAAAHCLNPDKCALHQECSWRDEEWRTKMKFKGQSHAFGRDYKATRVLFTTGRLPFAGTHVWTSADHKASENNEDDVINDAKMISGNNFPEKAIIWRQEETSRVNNCQAHPRIRPPSTKARWSMRWGQSSN